MHMADKKLPIAWWEECLRNQRSFLKREEAALATQEDRVTRLRREIEFEEQRFATAKAAGRDAYSHNYKRREKPCGMN